jgi:predicted GIY-YIG superfamily endonuclease
MLSIYIIQLEDNKYYIGKSTNVDFRLETHFNSHGSAWTTKYKPVKVIEIINNCDDFDEDKYTLKYMAQYGIDNVRGGTFCQIILETENENTIKKMINSATDKCYTCYKQGHFAAQCPQLKKYDIPKKSGWFAGKCYKNAKKRKNKLSNLFKKTTKKKIICYRCGRETHLVKDCYATTHIKGHVI